MLSRLCATVSLLCLSVLPAAAQIYNSDNGHYYMKVNVPAGISWPDAKAAAETMSYAGVPGHLITITSDAEQSFLASHFSDLHGYWYGGYQDTTAPDYSEPSGGWRWVTGEPWNYTHWNSGEPSNSTGYKGLNANEDALVGWTSDGYWNDAAHILVDSSDSRGYMVEFDTNLPAGYLYYGTNGHYYQKVDAPGGISWDAANSAAASLTFQNLRGHLVTITDADEQTFLSNNMGDLRGYWYGGYQDTSAPDDVEPSGGWRWITGEFWRYTNWNSGEPNDNRSYNGLGLNEDRLVGWSTDGRWNDLANPVVRVADSRGYVVEFETITPNISGLVTLEGCTNTPQTVLFQFRSQTGNATFSRPVALASDGSFAVGDVPADHYHLAIKGYKWLQAVVAADTTGGPVSNLSASLSGGDADNNNLVDVGDFGVLVNAYGGDSSDPTSGYDDRADFTCDGAIDLADFGLLVNNFGLSGDP